MRHWIMRERAVLTVIAGVACTILLSACGNATAAPPATTTTTSVGVAPGEVIRATGLVSRELTAAFVAYKKVPTSAVAVIAPRDVRLVFLPRTRAYWAIGTFTATRRASLKFEVSLQNGGGNGFFYRPKGGQWKLVGIGYAPFCYTMHVLPKVVRTVLKLEACPNGLVGSKNQK